MKFRIFIPTAEGVIRDDWKDYEDILTVKYNNKDHLCKIYNKAIEDNINENTDCLIISHDDIRIEDKFIFEKLEKAFLQFDIVGVTGQVGECPPNPYKSWIHEQNGWNSGCLKHTNKEWIDKYGNFNQCIFLDGCFLALNLKKLKGLRFDEELPYNGLHKYDVDFCINATIRYGLKCGTAGIWVRHDSEAITSNESMNGFNECIKYFAEKWSWPLGHGFNYIRNKADGNNNQKIRS